MSNKTKEFLDELSILLNDFHVVSMRMNNSDVCFTFDNQSQIKFDRFTIDSFHGIKTIEFEPEYQPSCISNVQGK